MVEQDMGACPSCGRKIVSTEFCVGDRPMDPPRPGDLTICAGCGELAEYDATCKPVVIKDQEAVLASLPPSVRALREHLRVADAKRL